MEILGAILLADRTDASEACAVTAKLASEYGLDEGDASLLCAAVADVAELVLRRSGDGDIMFALRARDRTELTITARDNWPMLEELDEQEAPDDSSPLPRKPSLESLVDDVFVERGPTGRVFRLIKRLPEQERAMDELAVHGQKILLSVIVGNQRPERQQSYLMAALRERLRLEGERKAEEEKLLLALEVAELGVCEIDPDVDAPKLNPQALALLGVESAASISELIGQVRDSHKSLASAVFDPRSDVPPYFELAITVDDEDLRWLGVHVRRVMTDSGLLRLVALKDITPQKRAQKEAEDRVALEEQFLGIVSHDLKNPLATTTMGAENLLSADLKQEHRKTVELVRRAADHAIELVHDLQDFTRARLGRGIPMDLTPLDLKRLCADVAKQAEVAHAGRSIELTGDAQVRVNGDPVRLRQVVSNLLANALAYSPDDTTVTISVRASETTARLEITNHGEPISEERLAQIFEPLNRGGRKSRRRNLGLGLFIVREVVKGHHGSVSVTSSCESGTTFAIELPLFSASSPHSKHPPVVD